MLKIDPTKYQNKRYFDENQIPDDIWLVLQATSRLEIPEFKLFEIAYKEWFGETGDEETIEKYFIPYMFNNIVPPWVRHFASRVIELDNAGKLDPRAFGIVPKFATRESIRKGIDFGAWLVLWLTGIIVLAKISVSIMDLPCMFPPCY